MSILLGWMQRHHFLFVVDGCFAELILVLALCFLQEHVLQILFLFVVVQARDLITSQGFVRRVLRLLQLQQSWLLWHARLIID